MKRRRGERGGRRRAPRRKPLQRWVAWLGLATGLVALVARVAALYRYLRHLND